MSRAAFQSTRVTSSVLKEMRDGERVVDFLVGKRFSLGAEDLGDPTDLLRAESLSVQGLNKAFDVEDHVVLDDSATGVRR